MAEFRLFSLHQVIQFIYYSQAFSVSNLYPAHVLVTNFSYLEGARNSGSLGCGVSGVIVTFIQIWRGNEARISRSSASLAARNNPMLRHSPGPRGGRQSRTKWPALVSSAARTASAERNSSTLAGLVPSGTVVTRSVRNSMGFFFRSPGFSCFCQYHFSMVLFSCHP